VPRDNTILTTSRQYRIRSGAVVSFWRQDGFLPVALAAPSGAAFFPMESGAFCRLTAILSYRSVTANY
jgi:hypothetical protein